MYKILRVTGDYRARQAQANAANAALYLEQHVNSSTSESPDYGLGVVATNASQRSREIAAWYAAEAGRRFDVGGPTDADVGYGTGVRVGGRGNNNIYHTKMPAVLLEPWFASNPKQAVMMHSPTGVNRAAALLAETVQKFVLPGNTIALSIGHAGKPSNPRDRGAAIYGGGTEAAWSTAVVVKAEKILTEVPAQEQAQEISLVVASEDQSISVPLDIGAEIRLTVVPS